MMKRLIIFVFVMMLVSIGVYADESGDTNACEAGGSMENRCNVDYNHDGEVDEYESEWAWQCGWYVARVEEGSLSASELPDGCNHTVMECYTILPELIDFFKDEFGDIEEINLLYEISLIYFGSPNIFGNSRLYENANCAGDGYAGYSDESISIFYGIVVEDDEYAAMDICAEMGGLGILPISYAFNAPMNYWACVGITGIDITYISVGNAMGVLSTVVAETRESR